MMYMMNLDLFIRSLFLHVTIRTDGITMGVFAALI